MRSLEEVCRLMGAKAAEVEDVAETEDGTVVTIAGYRTLIRPDGSLAHGVAEPEVEIVGEVSEEDAEKIAAFVSGEVRRLGSGEVTGDGSGEALPPIDENDPVGLGESVGREFDTLADATVAEVLEWVGGDAELAHRALAVEESRDAPRSTLLTALRKLAG